jgi:ADP-ribose pyrophosphatase
MPDKNEANQLQTLAEGRFLRLVRLGRWEYADRINVSGAAVLVALTPDRRLLLVEQYRIPCGCRVIELPAGIAGDEPGTAGEGLLTAAVRELREETGYEAGKLEEIMTGPSSAGLTSELVTFVYASQLRRIAAGGDVEGEGITLHEIPLQDINIWLTQQISRGLLVDPKVYAGIYFATQRI